MNDLTAKLAGSSLFGIYQKAFREATGLPLAMVPPGAPPSVPCGGTSQGNNFCHLLNSRIQGGCPACVRASAHLVREAGGAMRTTVCFAGLQQTVVPVRLGRTIVAYLMTGQVGQRKPIVRDFRQAVAHLAGSVPDAEIEKLKNAYRSTPVVDRARYDAAVTLLAAFSLQLGGLANRIALADTESVPPIVTRAKTFVEGHLDGPIGLSSVCAHLRVSRFYFCKVFKRSTGMTLTEFIGRRRIELAKGILLRTDRRITEIAFAVGFQSLSQFNRSFAKFTGESPTEFRAREASVAA